MLFDKNIEPCCSYCGHGDRISETEVICTKKGIMSSGGYCRRFTYNPLKRKPSKPLMLNTANYSEEDFEL